MMKKILRSLTSVPSLLAGGSAALLAVALHSWPIAALGLAASAAFAAADIRQHTFRFPRVTDPETAQALRAFVTARTALAKVVVGADAVLGELDANAAKLALHAQEIGEANDLARAKKERIVATLLSVAATLEAVRLRALDRETDEALSDLEAMNETILTIHGAN